jgi:hypothetical protein
MKKIFTFLSCAILASQLNAQSVQNGDFEGTWRNVSIIPILQVSEVPEKWTCSDSLVGAIAPIAALMGYNITPEKQCYKETNAHGGTHAVGIKTIMVLDTVVLPGMFTNGTISFDIAKISGGNINDAISISGGTPVLDKRVDTVTAYILLDTVNKYGAMVNISASKNRDGVKAVIGTGAAFVSPLVGYQEIKIAMNYTDPKNTKTDTLLISFISAVPASGDTLKEDGNYVIIDDVSASFSEGVYEPNSITKINTNHYLNVHPNPVNNDVVYFTFKNALLNNHSLVITDINGRIVYTAEMNKLEFAVNTAAFQNGIYTYYLLNETKQAIESGKIIITK